MKKAIALVTVIALCTIGAAAFAAHEIADVDRQVASGAIQVYGRAGLSVDIIDTDNQTAGEDKTLTKISSNSSRIGLKGSEDLGDGLSAVFQVEIAVDMDNTLSTNLRNTYAGLSHKSFGTVILGKHDTPYKTSTGKLDPFSETMGDYNAIIGNINGTPNFDLRPGDVIAYVSPKIADLQVIVASVQTGTETSNGTAPNPKAYSASAVYESGPIYVGLGYEIHKDAATTWETAGQSTTGTKLGVGYAMGDATLNLIYEKIDGDNTNYSRDAYYASATYKMGKETLKLAYGMAKDVDAASDTGASMIAAGIDHSFSKRTLIYALYAMTKNDSGATYGLGQSGAGGKYAPTTAGEDPSVISFGIRHDF